MRSLFFICLTIYVLLRLSQAHFARIGITAVPLLRTIPLMHAFTRAAHFRALVCIRARSNVYADGDANAYTRGGDGNYVNFDRDGTYW